MDPLSVLLFLGFILVFITVLGHGIWLFLAFIFRQLSGEVPAAKAGKPCPYCRQPSGIVGGKCMFCGRVPQVTPATSLEQDLEATARHLKRLLDRKIIQPQQFEELMLSIRTDLARLRGEAPQVAPIPATLAPPQVARTTATPPQPPVTAEIVDAEVVPDGINWVEPPKPAAPAVPLAPRPVTHSAAKLQPNVQASILQPPPPKNIPVEPEPPARPWSEMLLGFLEESNVRWMEILAGFIIVVSAVGLIISFRNTLKDIPYAPAILFMLFTLAFYGAGMYTLRSWKLHVISRVILIISLLLVPLSFAAAIVMAGTGDKQRDVTDPLFLAAVAIGAVVYSFVTYTTSRELISEGRWRLTIAVMVASLSQIVVNRVGSGAVTLWEISLLAALPVTGFLATVIGQVLRARSWRRLSLQRAHETFLVLGLSVFALAVPLSLLLHHAAERWVTLARLSPALSVVAAGILAIGLVVHRRALAKALAPHRTAGTAIAIIGGLAMLAMVWIAWPEPQLLVAVGLLNCVLLALLAVAGKLPLVHAPALACGTLACLVGFHWAQGRFGIDATSVDLIQAALMGRSGLVLTMLALVAGGVGAVFLKQQRREDGLVYFGGAASLCGLSTLVALVCGLAPLTIWKTVGLDSDLAAPLLLFYAAAVLSTAYFVRVLPPLQAVPALAGSALLWISLALGLTLNETLRGGLASIHPSLLPAHPVLLATLLHAVLNILLTTIAAPRLLLATAEDHREADRLPLWDAVILPLASCGVGTLLCCTPFIFWPHQEQLLLYAGYAGIATAVWLFALLLLRQSIFTYGLQSMLALFAGYIGANVMYHQLTGELWYLKVRHLHLQLLLIAVGGIVFAILRRVASRQEPSYERFTDRARKVLLLTTQEARRFNHEYIGTEHILLGLVEEGSGVAAAVLKKLNVDLHKIRLEVEKLIQPGPQTFTRQKLLQTPRARNVIEYAIEEARNLKHDYVGTEHILLGVLREQECVAYQILLNIGLRFEVVREELIKLLGPIREVKGTREEGDHVGREAVSVFPSLLINRFPAVDQLLLTLAVRMVPGLAIFAAWHGLWFELGVFQAPPEGPLTSQMPIAGGPMGWMVMAVVFVSLLISLWERVTLPALMGIAVTLFAIPWLIATWWSEEHAVASAARWLIAIYGLCGAALFIFRTPIHNIAQMIPGLSWGKFRRTAYYSTAWQPLAFSGFFILVLTVSAVIQQVNGVKLGGPLAESLFDKMGPTISYAVPLYALVAILLGYCVREKQPLFALGASAVSQFAVNLAFMLRVATGTKVEPSVCAIEWLQWNAIAAGGFGLLWLVMRRWAVRKDEVSTDLEFVSSGQTSKTLTDIQLAVAAIGSLCLVVWSAGAIFVTPASATAELTSLGSLLSYLAVGITAAVALLDAYRYAARQAANMWPFALLAVISLVAATCDQFDLGRHWLSYHILLAGCLGVAALATVASALGRSVFLARLAPSHWTAFVMAMIVTVMAIRAAIDTDPQQPWWATGAMIGVCLIFVAQGIIRRRQPYAYASLLVAPLGVFLFWLGSPIPVPDTFVVEASIIGVCGLCAIWLGLEIQSQRTSDLPFDSRAVGPPAHHIGIVVATIVFALRLCFGTFVDAVEPFFQASPQLGRFELSDLWILGALIALAAVTFRSLWDRRAFFVLPTAYVLGLLFTVDGLRHANLSLIELTFAAAITAAVYVALTGQLWSYGANLANLGSKFGVSDTVGGLARTSLWLPAISIGITAVISAFGLIAVLNHQQLEWRVATALGPAIAAWGISCLAQKERQGPAQIGALLLAGLSAIFLAWAQLPPAWTETVTLERVFRLLMTLSALTFLYGLVLPRFLFTTGSWNSAVRKCGYASGVLAIVTFVVVLGMEVALFKPGIGAPVADLQVAAVAVVLVALVAGLLSMALLPGRDPLSLDEKGKTFYVYGAQAVSGLLFAHLYVCRPMWFDSVLRPYWPFIILGLAFAAVAAAEIFQRQKIRVLAEPFRNTGGLLPLIPALAMFLVPAPNAPYELVLFLVGLMYLVLCMVHRSILYGAAAAVAGNAALWVLLQHQGVHFADHPQFWLIPPAVAVLLAAQLNRTRLTPEQLTTTRYLATIVIYLSSTSEIFLHSAAYDIWPPMILAALSVAGALAGVMLRIRAFLYLGTCFTVMALLSMVWHATQVLEQTWPWWAFGFTVGIALLVLFAVFEKKKEEVKLLIARMRSWEQ